MATPNPEASWDDRLLDLARSLAALHAARDLEELAGHVERLGERSLGALVTVLLLCDEAGEYRVVTGSLRRPVAAESLREQLAIGRITQNAGVMQSCRSSAATGAPASFPVDDLFGASPAAITTERCRIVPIAVAGQSLGCALFVSHEDEAAATLSAILVQHVGVAVTRLRELDEARRLPGFDAELWIPDEASMRTCVTMELSRARRYGGSVSLTLLRLEFEPELRAKFGDFYTGHLLRRVGGYLKQAVRDTDFLGTIARRFAIVQPATDLDGAEIAAERLSEALGSMLARDYPELDLSLIGNISAACAVASAGSHTAAQLIEEALAPRPGAEAGDANDLAA